MQNWLLKKMENCKIKLALEVIGNLHLKVYTFCSTHISTKRGEKRRLKTY